MDTAAASSRILPTVVDLVSLTKPRLASLVIATAAVGMAMAPGNLPLASVVIMLLATVLVVGSANVLNCWMERHTDGLMARTRDRALPAGRIDSTFALSFGVALALVSVPVLLFAINLTTGLIALLALLSYVLVYTPLKPRTPHALLVGALPGALPPLMGWTAATGEVGAGGLLLFAIVFLWQMPHVIGLTSYRMREYEAAGIRVLPAVRGERVARRLAFLWTLPLLSVSLALTPLGIGGRIYLLVALVLGVVYSAATLRGAKRDPGAVWGRRLFLTSLFYLPLLFTALVLNQGG